ncbi:hypothetical protein L7F22_043737 [Adiantum nelumboides]|nr:hypothetical protein [Adiantum nelumboides]
MHIQHWRCLASLARRSSIRLEGNIVHSISKDGYAPNQQSRAYSDQASSSSSSRQVLDKTSQQIWKNEEIKVLDEFSRSKIKTDEHQVPLETLIAVLNDIETPDLDRVGAYRDLRSMYEDVKGGISDEGILLLSEQAVQQGYTHIVYAILHDLHQDWFGLEIGSLRRSKVLCSILLNLEAYFKKSIPAQSELNHLETQVDHFKSAACTRNMEFACKILNENIMSLKEKGQDIDLTEEFEPHTALHLSTSIAFMDADYEMAPLLSALLDLVLNQPPSTFKEVNGMRIFVYALSCYLCRSRRIQMFHERAGKDPFSYSTRIVELVDQCMSMYGMSTSLKLDLYSRTLLDRLMDRCELSPINRNTIQVLLSIQSTLASMLLQTGSYAACMNVFFEMLDDFRMIFTPTFDGKVTMLDLELILLIGFRYTLRSATSEISKDIYDSRIVSRLLPILIRHALLDNRSDDLLWLRDFGNRLVDSGEAKEFVNVVKQTVKELDSVNEGNAAGFDVLAMFGGQLITSAIEQISRNREMLLSFLCALQIVHPEKNKIGDARVDLIFLDDLRTRLIITCMKGGLRMISKGFFLRWREVRVKEPITFALINAKLSLLNDLNEEGKDVSEQTKEEAEQIIDGAPSAVSSSSHCASLIVADELRLGAKKWHKMIGERSDKVREHEENSSTDQSTPGGLIPRHIKSAYDVLLSFLMSKRRREWNEKDRINVAHMLFRLGHSREAQLCLSTIAKDKARYPENTLAILARGIADSDVEEGVKFLEQRSEAEDSAQLITDKVIGPIFILAMLQGRIELIHRLLRLSEKSGTTEGLAMRSRNVLAMTAYDKQGTGFKDHFEAKDEVKLSDDSPIDNLFDDVRATQSWLYTMLDKGLLSTDPEIIKKMIIGCIERAKNIRQEYEQAGKGKIGDATSDRMNRLASTLLQYSAQNLQSVDDETTMLVLSAFHVSAGHQAKGGNRAYRQQRINELDAIVGAIRWVTEYRITPKHWKNRKNAFNHEKMGSLVKKTKSNLIDSNTLINVLPPITFRSLILAYSRLNDNLGMASVIQWLRDECDISLVELSKGWKGVGFAKFIKKRVYLSSQRGSMDSAQQTLNWISGQESVPLIKSWWYEPKQNEDLGN